MITTDVQPLYRFFGLTPRDFAEVIIDVAETIAKETYPEVKVIRKFKEKYSGDKLIFAVLVAGKVFGMLNTFITPPEFSWYGYNKFISLVKELEKTKIEELEDKKKKLIEKVVKDIELDELSMKIIKTDKMKDVM